jgi:uncharacterized protein (DUF433 family)
MTNTPAIDLLERPVYGLGQVDRVLDLNPGTARRWIDGYTRHGKTYPPVVRVETTGEDIVTWGEFVETRLLAEYRDAGVPLVRMRPAIDRLRERSTRWRTPAHSLLGKSWCSKRRRKVGLARQLQIVVVRNNQIVLTDPAENFYRSADFAGGDGIVERLRPHSDIKEVVIDPLRQFGEPVVRSVPTEIVAEQVRAGESIDAIAELYELPRPTVEAVLRYELYRGLSTADAA